jgi:predicted permease
MLESFWQDLRYSVRSLRRTPVLAATVIVTLALGIGANTAIFSLLNAVVLRTLPLPAPHELSLLSKRMPPSVGDVIGSDRSDIFAYTAVERFERALPAGVRLAALSSPMRLDLRLGSDDGVTSAFGQLVSGGYFSTLGVTPAAGRLISFDDNRTIDGHPVAVLGYRFAERQFSLASAALGRTIPINGVAFTVVGVAEPSFTGTSVGTVIDIWLPVAMQHAVAYQQNVATHNAEGTLPWLSQSGIEWLNVVVRAPGRDIDTAHTGLTQAYRQEAALEAERRGADDEETRRLLQSELIVEPFAGGFSVVRTQFAEALLLLMAMVVILLLIACANIANLLLARASSRQAEIGIRLSLGAGRGRLIRQLAAESALLSLLGCLAALPLARWLSVSLAELALVRNTLPQGFSLDARVLWFATGITLATGVLFGLVPAFRATTLAPSDALKGGAATRGFSGVPVMRPLVAAQVSLSVLLVVAAALLGRSLLNLWNLDPGFDRNRLVSVTLAAPKQFAATPVQQRAMEARILERVRAIPGVVNAAFSTSGTLSGRQAIGGSDIEGYQPAVGEVVRLQENSVGPDYFATTGMVLREGRLFADRDIESGVAAAAIVNETTARRYFAGRSPLGRRIGYGPPDKEIVGVVSDARVNGLREAPRPMVFYPLGHREEFASYLDVRVTSDSARVGGDLRQAIAGAEPRLIIRNVVAIDESLERSLTRDRLVAYVASGFGATALLLACVGLYGVMSFAVVRRTREIGVRAALGARPADLLRLVIADGMRVVIGGLVLGVAGAVAGARLVEALLFDITPSDPITYAGVIVVLILAGFVACYMPARRAASVNPMAALRME